MDVHLRPQPLERRQPNTLVELAWNARVDPYHLPPSPVDKHC